MKLYYVVNARMPSNKAYGIQIAKMCEAFVEQGIEIELLIPNTLHAHTPLQEFYGLRVNVPTKILSGLDWYDRGSVGFGCSSLIFMIAVHLYLLRRRHSAIVYTIDVDSYSFSSLALLNVPLAAEMHSPKTRSILTRFFFQRVNYLIATNPLIKEKLVTVFNFTPEHCIVEPNGVDKDAFKASSKEDARKKLALPTDIRIALYVGRFYDWKGMSTLQKAAFILEESGMSVYLVGGSQEEFEKRMGGPSSPLRFGGSVRHKDIATWCAAADVLLILGTRANEFSYRYTAPMKLFEYLASGRPVVTAGTPALRSLVSAQETTFYTPDDPTDLARKVLDIGTHPDGSKQMTARGLQRASEHLWSNRAKRILAFVHAHGD